MKKYLSLISMAFLLLTAGVIYTSAIGSLRRNDTEMKAHTSASQGKATIESRTLSVRIDQPFARVYDFLVDPANWNKWAFGLGKSLRRSDGGWIADSDGGILKVGFTARNQYGVLDHTVIRPSGGQVYVPMRLITNGSGCELLFTLFREPGATDKRYNDDANFVQRDLNRLKELMEK
jgi:hypothetical protein